MFLRNRHALGSPNFFNRLRQTVSCGRVPGEHLKLHDQHGCSFELWNRGHVCVWDCLAEKYVYSLVYTFFWTHESMGKFYSVDQKRYSRKFDLFTLRPHPAPKVVMGPQNNKLAILTTDATWCQSFSQNRQWHNLRIISCYATTCQYDKFGSTLILTIQNISNHPPFSYHEYPTNKNIQWYRLGFAVAKRQKTKIVEKYCI